MFGQNIYCCQRRKTLSRKISSQKMLSLVTKTMENNRGKMLSLVTKTMENNRRKQWRTIEKNVVTCNKNNGEQ